MPGRSCCGERRAVVVVVAWLCPSNIDEKRRYAAVDASRSVGPVEPCLCYVAMRGQRAHTAASSARFLLPRSRVGPFGAGGVGCPAFLAKLQIIGFIGVLEHISEDKLPRR